MAFSFSRVNRHITPHAISDAEGGSMPADATMAFAAARTRPTTAGHRHGATARTNASAREPPDGRPERHHRAPSRQRRRSSATPALAALGVVCAAAARADRRRLLVRHRRPGDVDGRRLCRSRQGRRLDRRLRHRQGGRRHRRTSTSRPARFCIASIRPVPDRAGERQGQVGRSALTLSMR